MSSLQLNELVTAELTAVKIHVMYTCTHKQNIQRRMYSTHNLQRPLLDSYEGHET